MSEDRFQPEAPEQPEPEQSVKMGRRKFKNLREVEATPTEESTIKLDEPAPADVELGGGVMKEFVPDAVEQAVFVDPTPKSVERPVEFSARTLAEMEAGRALSRKRNG
jgi:hypothetical protein